MRISVLIATYNGEKYIEEQIKSLFDQTRPADELLFLDDCSSDATKEIIKKKSESFPQQKCRLVENERNLGWRKNFIKGFHICSGDIIFCCDQDDIWDKNKLKEMEEIMQRNEHINVLASNLTPLYENNAKRMSYLITKQYRKKILEKVEYNDYGASILRPGCTMCFRKEIINEIDILWSKRLAHDVVIWMIGLYTGSLFIYNKPLIKYRRHGDTNSPSNQKNIHERLNQAEKAFILQHSLYKNRLAFRIDKKNQENITREMIFAYKRIQYLRKESIIRAFFAIYHFCNYIHFRAWLVDVLCLLKHKYNTIP